MTVQQLLDLCLATEDKTLTVMFSDEGVFSIPSLEHSGVITFGEPCNEDGSPLEAPEGYENIGEEITVFALVTENAFETEDKTQPMYIQKED